LRTSFNTTNWGAPNTSFTSPLFLTYSAGSYDYTATLGYRRMQLGFRWRSRFFPGARRGRSAARAPFATPGLKARLHMEVGA